MARQSAVQDAIDTAQAKSGRSSAGKAGTRVKYGKVQKKFRG